ncbi:MAG: hypothetical protein H7249_03580 [Chitinophagaceae bacterium]|nr:hypothetical protein [Oligoflexus sp.]
MKSPPRLRLVLLISMSWTMSGRWGASEAYAAEPQPVPAIKYAGVLPVYWQGTPGPTLQKKKPWVESNFNQVVHDSKRFIFIDNTIVADNWSSTEGRKKLKDENELDAFVNLNVTEQGDVAIFTARLLSPELLGLITETDRLPLAWLASASEVDLTSKMRDLTYRVLNRYPIDVFVTSLQGRYLTLSAGKDQNVLEGDILEFGDFNVKSSHPVDGTWLTFDQKPLGKAKIIESKSQSSVALITSLTSENAIRVGSGARVENIASRRNFRSKPIAEEAFVAIDNSPLVVAKGQEPKTADTSGAPTPAPKKPKKDNTKTPAAEKAEALPTEVTDEPMHPAVRGGSTAIEGADKEGPAESNGLDFPVQDVRFSLESNSWSYGNAASASSQLSPILINQVGARAEHNLDATTTTIVSAHVQSGSTAKGSYFGLALAGEYLFKIASPNAIIPSLDRLLVGGHAEIETVGVTKEKFGGTDAIHLAPVVHAQGSYHIVDMVQTIDYDVTAMILPFNFGNAGIKGNTKQLGSGMGFDVEAQVLAKSKTEQWEWGGLIGLRQMNEDLSSGSLSTSTFRIGLLGRVKL